MTRLSLGVAPPPPPPRMSPHPQFSLAANGEGAASAGSAAREPRPHRPLWNEAGALEVEGMRPQPLVGTRAPNDPFLRGLAAPPRSLPGEAPEGFDDFRWIGAEAAPGLFVGADHAPGGSRFGVTTTGSALTNGGWSGFVVTQPHGPDAGAPRLRAQVGGSTDFALSDDLRGAFKGNAAVETDSGASAHADLSLTTGGGTGIGVAFTAGPDGVAQEAYIRQQIADSGTLSGRVVRPADGGDTEWRLRYDASDFRAEVYRRGDDDWGASVNLRMRW